MHNLKRIRAGVSVLFACLLISGCSHGSKSQNETSSTPLAKKTSPLVNYSPKRIETSEPITLGIRGELNREERTRFQSRSVTKKYEGTQMLNEKTEIVDFVVRSKTTKVSGPHGPFTFLIDTVSKDGSVDLHDLAFPELGETLEYVLTSEAKVLKAGKYPSNSIFFVPPLSVLKTPVKVGDTWTLSHGWTSLNNGVPLTLELVTIFKNVFECAQKQQCAELEVSGTVSVPSTVSADLKMESKVTGRMLVLIKTGSLVWSDVRTTEHLQSGNLSIDVISCLESVLEEPASDRWLWRPSPQCDPTQSLPEKVPGA